VETILIMIESAEVDAWDITITKTTNNKVTSCIESVVFRIGEVIAFEPEITDAEAKYIKSILINQ